MERALSIGATDIIGIARPLAIDPDLPKNAASNPQYVQNVRRPTTGIKFVDRMFMIPVTFYEAQMRRMGRGKDPDPNMSAWSVFLETGRDVGMAAFKKRRA